MTINVKECPVCGQKFKYGWIGFDHHWKMLHGWIIPYTTVWPVISAGYEFQLIEFVQLLKKTMPLLQEVARVKQGRMDDGQNKGELIPYTTVWPVIK